MHIWLLNKCKTPARHFSGCCSQQRRRRSTFKDFFGFTLASLGPKVGHALVFMLASHSLGWAVSVFMVFSNSMLASLEVNCACLHCCKTL